ncbi:MAG: phosphoadenosine phosphosulfate reductase family protein [Desulfosporosinus sp.]
MPLEAKIAMTSSRIREWYEYWDGQVYVSFSGGNDSTVLLNLVRNLYPEVPAVFIDTGLEFPEIRKHVKTYNNVVIIKPEVSFEKVLAQYGYPVISKDVSRRIRYAQKGSNWAVTAMQGLEIDGTRREKGYKQAYVKYRYLLDAPFKVSDKCCEILKERPARKYGRESGRKAYIGLLAEESRRRKAAYLKAGCNSFNGKLKSSKPMMFWRHQDVLEYIKSYNLPYAEIYGDIVNTPKGLTTTGAMRTGCMFCMFGTHLEKGENRFQRMCRTHPKQYNYCINSLGLGGVLDYIGVDYRRNSLFDDGV